MAFCEFCGKELGPDGKCDCPQSQQAAEAKAQKSPLKNKKVLIGAAAAVVVVVIAVIIGVAVSSANSYKAPINNLVKLINQQNTDITAYYKLIADPFTVKLYQSSILKKSESYKDLLDECKDDLEEYYDDIQGFKITKCDISSAKEMSKSELNEIKNQLPSKSSLRTMIETIEDYDDGDYAKMADSLDISEGDARKLAKAMIDYYKSLSDVEITEGYKLTVRLYAAYDGDTDMAEKVKDVRVVKVNGTWVLYDAKKLLQGSRFTEDLSAVSLSRLYSCIRQLGGFAEGMDIF